MQEDFVEDDSGTLKWRRVFIPFLVVAFTGTRFCCPPMGYVDLLASH
jgi:hypothetical protein